MKNFLPRILSLLVIGFPIVLFGWLLWIELVPSGVFEIVVRPGETSPYADRLLPDARVSIPTEQDGEVTQKLLGDPVFFFIHPHRQFDRVDIEVHFKNHGVPLVELGGLATKEPEVYDLHPLANTLLDTSSWSRVQSDEFLLLQRTPTFASMEAFFANPPSSAEVATYQTSFPHPTRLPEYTALPGTRTIDASLRGAFALKTYLKQETLAFDMAFMDMNRDIGLDPVSLVVINEQGETVYTAHAPDDGNTSDDLAASGLRKLTVSLPRLPEGVYKLEWRAGDDIFVRTIETAQSKFVFLETLSFGDEAGWRDVTPAINFVTDAKHLVFSTTHASAVQEVRVGEEVADISVPYVRVPVEVREEGLVQGVSPKGDIDIAFDGGLAFSPEQFFRPDPIRLRWNTDVDRRGVSYILARYTPPDIDQEGFSIARASFDTRTLLLQDGAWKIAFSLPGIEELGASFEVKEIRIRESREPFTPKDVFTWLRSFIF